MAISKLVEEDPTLRVNTDHETGQVILRGMGELHLEIIIDRLKREFKVEINQGAPQVAYKEALTKSVEHKEVYKKQTGGRGKFADIVFEIGPREELGPEDKPGLEFVNDIVGGVIPREFIPAIQKGFEQSMVNGSLAGYPIDNMKVRVFHGSYHDVDSNENAFKMAASIGFKDGMRKADPVLLEPIMAVEVETPEDYMGDVMGDLSSRRGMIQGMEDTASGGKAIRAEVPLSEMFGYATTVRSLSQGRASYSMEFKHYAEAPRNVAEAIMNKK
jgi:elongation factor G